MAIARKPEPAPKPSDPLIPPCCNRRMVGVDIILSDGDDYVVIGRTLQCSTEYGIGAGRVECRTIHSVKRGKDWPASLSVELVRQIFNGKTPTYFKRSGHHIKREGNSWSDCRKRNRPVKPQPKDTKAAAAGEEAPQP